jgi:hypothetical protein
MTKLTNIPVRVLIGGFAALILSLTTGAALVSADSARSGDLHLVKDCPPTTATGLPGGYCTVTSSSLAEIKFGSKLIYDQGADFVHGFLDSNVVLDAGNGNKAIGRCTFDFTTGLGLCTFSDGMGQFTGFHARVNVVCPTEFCTVNGDYSFSSERDR